MKLKQAGLLKVVQIGDFAIIDRRNGRVMIYDGLKSETIDKVMDEQFDRIDNMMFICTRYLQDDGHYEVEEDGCE